MQHTFGSVDCHCLSFSKNKNDYIKTCKVSVIGLEENLRDHCEAFYPLETRQL